MGTKHKNIDDLRRELIYRYIFLLLVIILVYTIIFEFFIVNVVIAEYFAFLGGGLSISCFIIRKRYFVNNFVYIHLILIPLYSFYIILTFWESSNTNFTWLVPVPLAVYIFFPINKVTIYITGAIFAVIILVASAKIFPFRPIHNIRQNEIIVCDVITFASNLLIVFLLTHYKDRIRKSEILSEMETDNMTTTEKEGLSDTEKKYYEKLYLLIDSSVSENMLFTKTSFNIQKLSKLLKVKQGDISKTLRYKGYSNFNGYINKKRIDHVKHLLNETDLSKVTLLYIYTDAGFSNQSTFNRVFKQIEGCTPTEYIQDIEGKYE